MTEEQNPAPGVKKRKNRKVGSAVSNLVSWIVLLVFCALLLFAVTAVYMSGSQDERPRVLFGYSVFIVLTDSMRSEIPQGSLVIVEPIAPDEIQIGDDITFLRSDLKTITHRVININDDYEQSGMRGFVTKGVDNPEPDRETVFADNVVGRVMFHNLWLGAVLSYVRDRVWVIPLLAVLAVAFFSALRWMFRSLRPSNDGPAIPGETECSENPDETDPGEPQSESAVTHQLQQEKGGT